MTCKLGHLGSDRDGAEQVCVGGFCARLKCVCPFHAAKILVVKFEGIPLHGGISSLRCESRIGSSPQVSNLFYEYVNWLSWRSDSIGHPCVQSQIKQTANRAIERGEHRAMKCNTRGSVHQAPRAADHELFDWAGRSGSCSCCSSGCVRKIGGALILSGGQCTLTCEWHAAGHVLTMSFRMGFLA